MKMAKVKQWASNARSLPLQCWARVRIYPPTKGPLSSNNSPNSPSRNSPKMPPQMSLPLPSMAKTSHSPTCFTFFSQNGASTNATATSGRSSALRCGCVARHYLILPFHSFTLLQARIALLEGERRSFENIKVDLMRRIKMLEYALRVERLVSILSSTAFWALTRPPEQFKATFTIWPSRIPVDRPRKGYLFAVFLPEGRDIQP